MRVLVQLRASTSLHAASRKARPEPSVSAAVTARAPSVAVDSTYPPVQVPHVETVSGGPLTSYGQEVRFSFAPQDSTYLVRGTVPDGEAGQVALAEASAHPDVVGVFADPVIESTKICGGDPPLGTDAVVARRLVVRKLWAKGLTGNGVAVAVVDTGINLQHLVSRGRAPVLSVPASWTPQGVATAPGQHPVNHGTMCAYDVGIAAPKATLLDHAVLLTRRQGGTVMAGLLSDAVLSYSKLRTVLGAMPQKKRALVVTNSWGMFSQAWDYPPGHPGNYSDNPLHPFNVIVGSLEAAGADVLFAAGNCGRDCPDGRCNFGATLPICGANSHPRALSIGGVDVSRHRVGYSSQGPGRLARRKPDLMGYTHFKGSGVYPADGGTSAACPVVAGVVAAVRTKLPATRLSPAQLRTLLRRSAFDLGGVGFDYDHGFGVVDPDALLPLLP